METLPLTLQSHIYNYLPIPDKYHFFLSLPRVSRTHIKTNTDKKKEERLTLIAYAFGKHKLVDIDKWSGKYEYMWSTIYEYIGRYFTDPTIQTPEILDQIPPDHQTYLRNSFEFYEWMAGRRPYDDAFVTPLFNKQLPAEETWKCLAIVYNVFAWSATPLQFDAIYQNSHFRELWDGTNDSNSKILVQKTLRVNKTLFKHLVLKYGVEVVPNRYSWSVDDLEFFMSFMKIPETILKDIQRNAIGDMDYKIVKFIESSCKLKPQ